MQAEKEQKGGSAAKHDGHEVARLRLLFLVPLAFTILAIVTALMLALYWHENDSIHQDVIRTRASAQIFYESTIRYDASALQAVMDTLRRDPILQAALASHDRQRLLTQATPLFDELKKDYAITHLYFSGIDRVNLLRVHDPNLHGDRIDRITTLSAEQNGTTSFGVELGPLGTFTLRLVTPWYNEATRQLIGYVELGMEINGVLQKLHDFLGVEVLVLVHKEHLDRRKWEDGMRTLGRTPDWERFPAVVLSSQTPQAVPPLLAERLARGELGDSNTIVKAVSGDASERILFLPLQDTGGSNVAHMVLITDVSGETNAVFFLICTSCLTALSAGILLLCFFNWQVGRIGRRIEGDTQALEELATHDGLTGMFNHRAFYTFLEEEISRAHRYQHPLSLLIIDIDHFKRINDTHGHQGGDAILRGLNKRIADQLRRVDRVCRYGVDRICRYGGDEIMVILPETDGALVVAERLCAAFEATPFDLGTDNVIGVTVSIGVACFPLNANTSSELVSAADAALYAAKHGGRNRVCEYKSSGPVCNE